MKKHRMLISILIFAFFAIQINSHAANSETGSQEELEVILKKCAEYCERLENSVLDFVCEETMKEDIYSISSIISSISSQKPISSQKNVYVYDYQLTWKIHKKGCFHS